MNTPFLRFEDGKVNLGGQDLLVNEANLSISNTLEEERVYGDVNKNIVGSNVDFQKYAAKDGVKGELSLGFYITADTFLDKENANSINKLFKIAEGMGEEPLHSNTVGRYHFDHMYLKRFNFEIAPFKVVKASVVYDVYGSIRRIAEKRFNHTDKNFAHGLKSFGELKISNINDTQVIPAGLEISNLKYSISVERKVHGHIRDNEHTSINTKSTGTLPYRVSVEKIETEMSLDTNEAIPYVNPYGDYQPGSSPEGIQDTYVNAYLYSLEGRQIADFSCRGKIYNQSTSLSEGSLARSNLVIKGVVK